MKLKLSGLFLSFILASSAANSSTLRTVANDIKTQEDGEKGIQSAEVVERRALVQPTNPRAKTSTPPQRNTRRRTYSANRKRLKVQITRNEEDVRLGVTLFRYEPPGTTYTSGVDGTKDIGFEGNEGDPTPPDSIAAWKASDWTRATTKTQFAVGQVVRLHFEPLTKSGYLYIIHQEMYADGSHGEATLIFPTLKTNGGNNLIIPNQDLWVPRAGAFFRIKPSKSNEKHVGELITVVLRAEAPADILPEAIRDKAMSLTKADVDKLLKWANSDVIEMNLDGGEGEKQTATETQEGRKDIGMEGSESLTDADALPQNVFEARRKVGQAVVFRVPLRFKPNK